MAGGAKFLINGCAILSPQRRGEQRKETHVSHGISFQVFDRDQLNEIALPGLKEERETDDGRNRSKLHREDGESRRIPDRYRASPIRCERWDAGQQVPNKPV